jgi:hypothetical protein
MSDEDAYMALALCNAQVAAMPATVERRGSGLLASAAFATLRRQPGAGIWVWPWAGSGSFVYTTYIAS